MDGPNAQQTPRRFATIYPADDPERPQKEIIPVVSSGSGARPQHTTYVVLVLIDKPSDFARAQEVVECVGGNELLENTIGGQFITASHGGEGTRRNEGGRKKRISERREYHTNGVD